jgi:hypothetical protein
MGRGEQLSAQQVAEICDKAKVQLIVSGGRVSDIGPAVKAIRPHITVHQITQNESLAYRTNAHATGDLNGAADVNAIHAEFEKIKDELASITVPEPAYLLHSTYAPLSLRFSELPRTERPSLAVLHRRPRSSPGPTRTLYHVSVNSFGRL